jgi:hypothetical protein
LASRGSLQDADVSARRAGHRRAGGLFAEAVVERGLVDDVRELVLGQDVGQVDQGAGHGGDRDAAVDREVARVEVAAGVYMHAPEGAAARADDVDAFVRSAPGVQMNGGTEVALPETFAGREDRGHPSRFLREPRVADRVHTAMNAVQAAGADTMGDRAARQPERGQLPDRDQPVLAPRDLRDQRRPGRGVRHFALALLRWRYSPLHPRSKGRTEQDAFATETEPRLRTLSAMDPLERVRKLCLALPETSERLSHGQPTFFVGGKKTFVMYLDNHHDDGRLALWCAAPRGMQEALTQGEPEHYFRPPYVGHRGWIGVHLNKGLDWNEIAGAIEDAYLTVAPKRLVKQVSAR